MVYCVGKEQAMQKDLINEITENNPKACFIQGHDNAILGMVKQHGKFCLILYDPLKIIDNLMVNDGMSYEDAVEYFQYNIECAYGGKHTPAMLVRLENMRPSHEPDVEEDNP